MNSGKYYGPFFTVDDIKCTNPTIGDLLTDKVNEYLSIILFEKKGIDNPLFALYFNESTHLLVIEAFKYLFVDYDSLYIDEQKVCIGNSKNQEIKELTQETIDKIRSAYKIVLNGGDDTSNELPKEKIKFKNERQRKLWERREETRKLLEESRKENAKKDGKQMGLGDLIIGIGVMGNFTNEEILKFPFCYARDLFTKQQKQETFHLEVQTAMFTKQATLQYWLG